MKSGYVGGMTYSSAMEARGKCGANDSCWNVVYGPIWAVAKEIRSSGCVEEFVVVASAGVEGLSVAVSLLASVG